MYTSLAAPASFSPSCIDWENNVQLFQVDVLWESNPSHSLRVQPVTVNRARPSVLTGVLQLLHWGPVLCCTCYDTTSSAQLLQKLQSSYWVCSFQFWFPMYQQKLGDNRLQLWSSFYHIVIFLYWDYWVYSLCILSFNIKPNCSIICQGKCQF